MLDILTAATLLFSPLLISLSSPWNLDILPSEMSYVPRVVDAELTTLLAANGAVVVEGPKACGKTETARQQSASEVLLDVDANAQQAVAVDPALVLPGDRPRLLDEWQSHPALWNHVRRSVDAERQPGMYVLTGSAVPADDATRHTGAGRFGRLRMRPMALAESGVSNREVSLRELLNGATTQSPDPGLTVDDLMEEVVRGGWPGFRGLERPAATRAVRDYLDQVRRTDVSAVDGIRRDPEGVRVVLQSLARHTATSAKLTTIARDASGPDSRIKDETVAAYLSALERLMIVEDLPAWAPHLRSSYQLRTGPTRHFADPSLAAAALRATPENLLADFNTFGLLFESLVVRDLRVYAQACDATVSHYRDSSGLEVDAIVTTDAGAWVAVEVKLGSSAEVLDAAAANLRKFSGRVDTSKRGEPAALAIVVGTGYGYVRPDGVHVIPIGTLAP
ncbi:ATP-binding protein [Baekduia sp. Peel2402]|uniref:ATP-binding protein n=1 Tax=Baekduia sp. Peel2402 TaxID=3458296 RepID=UPI00403E98E4